MTSRTEQVKGGDLLDWDGHSPIDGEPVTEWFWLAGRQILFTASAMYTVQPKSAAPIVFTDQQIQH